MTHSRDSGGNLVPDPAKFPDGIKGTADYVHSLGPEARHLRGRGHRDLRRVPGQPRPRERRRQPFASWGVDYLKYDNCNNQRRRASGSSRYTAMRDALAATGRPIVYSLCNWGQDNVVDLGRRRRQQLAHHRRHQRQLRPACCRSSTATSAWPPTPGPGALERPGHAGGRQRHDGHRVPRRLQPVGGDGRAADRRHRPAPAPARPPCPS